MNKGDNVYMILYNYSDVDYSIIAIKSSLDDAYEQIKLIETKRASFPLDLKLLEIKERSEICKIDHKSQTDFFNILYINKQNEYLKLSVCDFPWISNYIIIPMIIS